MESSSSVQSETSSGFSASEDQELLPTCPPAEPGLIILQTLSYDLKFSSNI
jgi:hypothetical protein